MVGAAHAPAPPVPRTPAEAARRGPQLPQRPPGRAGDPGGAPRRGAGRGPPGGRAPDPPRLKVAVDVDEVLAQFLRSLNAYVRDEHGLAFEVADYSVYYFAAIWGCPPDVSNERVHAFFQSEHFRSGVEPIPGALEALTRLRATCDLEVVTSRQHVIERPTLDWLDAHFPGVFDAVHFGNHFALEGGSRKKSEICRDIGAHVLVDDNPGYALDCAEEGIDAMLFDWNLGYPWAKTEAGPVHPKITRVADWAGLCVELEALAAALAAAGA